MKTILITDSCCDLPYQYIKENEIEMIPLTITIDSKEKKDDLAKTKGYEAFYQSIREGAMPKTSQVNSYDYKERFEKHIKAGEEVLCICFSAALSGCFNSAQMAMEEVKEAYPEASIQVINSRCASMGQGLLIYYAMEQLKQGKSAAETARYLEQLKMKINHWFTVEDLKHLFRGGRVSRTTATVGTLLQIKPIMKVDEEGKLTAVEKVKGRKKSLKVLVEKTKELIENPEEQIVFVCHGDTLSEAELVKKALIEECHVKDVWINHIGAAVGSHAGPGTLGIFFVGPER